MKVAIYSRGLDEGQEQQLHVLLLELKKHFIDALIYEPLAKQYNLQDEHELFNQPADLHQLIECVISLGGDGTILDAVTFVNNTNIPILGINFGRLGFLASLGKDEMTTAVDALVNRTYIVDKRTLVHLDSNLPLFVDAPFALNEFAIHKRDISSMIKIHTYLNGEFLNTYWADGLVVSTPTGSTGYNMSCNGPIVFPDSKSFIITPVAPHNLNVRPIVVPDSTIISFEIEGRSEDFICALDARREIVNKDIQLAVKKEAFTVSLVRLSENNFLSTLRSKLTWGLDKRN